MRIKRIEIEGFKSYAQRQVVDNLDPQFNAITGLNGSGKSNILDSICYLLGISNLSHVRAHNLADLVYKQGQAGINRCTVTITFDNTDPNQQPVGYSKYPEIVVRRQTVINGRNTYQINGSAATNSRVSDLFRMVGMNVNNPHFLIMQGRITKVLNMKPLEILSMVEEAAGVRMYECKKQGAIRTIEKKETKVSEICKLMDEDILPRVEKLKKDRANYLEFQKIGRDIENLQRKLIAYDFFNSSQQIKHLESVSSNKMQESQTVASEIVDTESWIEQEQKSYENMEAQKSNAMSERRGELENAVKKYQTEMAKLESERDGKDSAQNGLRINIERKKTALNTDKKILEKKKAELTKKESEIGGEEQRGKNAEEMINKARQKLEALAKGMTTDDQGNAMTLDAYLTATRSQHTQLETNVKRAEMSLKVLKPSLEKKKAELKSISRKSDSDQTSKILLEKEINQLENQINSMEFDEEAEQRLDEERKQLCREKIEQSQAVDNFEAVHHYLQFKYSDPLPNFDRHRVNGVVAKLFKLKDNKYATAIEVAAGAKISNVVVDRAETGKALLQNGRLNKRVTFLPLDKIDTSGLSKSRMEEACRQVGQDNVFLAKDLIEYDPVLEPAMQHIFGNVLICANMDEAKKLTFDRNVNCRTVTFSGEDFRPSGVLTGGSRSNKASLLLELNAISTNYNRLESIENRIREIDDELRRLQPLRQEYEKMRTNLISCTKRLEAIVDSMKHSPIQILTCEIEQLEKEIPEVEAIVVDTRPELEALTEKIRTLEERKKNEKTFQEKEKKQAQKELKDAQNELNGLKGTFDSIKETLAALREEIASLETSIQEDEAEIINLTEQLNAGKSDMEEANGIVAEIKNRVQKAQKELEEFNKEMRSHDKAMRIKAIEIEDLKKKVKQLENKRNDLAKESKEASKNSKDYAARVQKLEKQHKWIAEEKKSFGEQGTVYSFENYNYEIGKREIEQQEDRRKELESMINTRAMHLLGTAEEQCRELEKKRQQLEKDKKQLYDAIKQLDEKKNRELVKAHEQISQDFGSIFSTLLPGTSAKLVPPSNAKSCLEGLEVKIAFNNKWKESLGELSGGQRSLVALSLILAMLKFKPAPIYILDEVDAALDMSHTQNIGAMIKKHFKESQFIIVSLKDGMFNNANVLYRTKFVDGTSTVARISNS